MGFATIKADLLAVQAALAEKSPGKILRAVSVVLNDVADVAELFAAGPDDEADKAACCEILTQLEAEASKVSASYPVDGPVGKIFPGDGSFLKALVSLFIKLAPLFIEPKPEA